MHLKSEGMGYRKVAKYLNGMGHKTPTGLIYSPSSVQSLIKRIHQREKKMELIGQEEKLKYSKIKINF